MFQNSRGSRAKKHSKKLSFSRPLVMGILNVTPDSFSDGGKYMNTGKALKRALQMAREGADIIDIGGESSGPGSTNVSLSEELKRVIPVVSALRAKLKLLRLKTLISVDTYKAEVALQAVKAGADMINDVTAFRGDAKMAKTVSNLKVPVVIMYSKDSSARTTRKDVHYANVVKTVSTFLKKQAQKGVKAGIKKNNIIIDPGMGAFISSDPKYSLQLLNHLEILKKLGFPLLIGASRKSFIGQVLNLPLKERLEGGLACAVVAVMRGASILRVHDVKGTRRVVDMASAITNS